VLPGCCQQLDGIYTIFSAIMIVAAGVVDPTYAVTREWRLAVLVQPLLRLPQRRAHRHFKHAV
jgi:hypothetical protein